MALSEEVYPEIRVNNVLEKNLKYFVTGPKFSQSLEMNVSAIFLKENMSKGTQDRKAS